MENSNIAWCDATWNIARGCTKVNTDCLYCYMMREGDRRKYDGKKVIRTKTVFNFPLKYKETKSSVWNGPPLIFTSSLTDFFHEDIDSYRNEAWDIIRARPDLIFQILTKRWDRVKDHLPADWGNGYENVWLGVSAGNQKSMDQISGSSWMDIEAKVKFLSIEPLTESLDEMPDGLDWIIVGGESGNENGKWRYRPCKLTWIYNIIQAAQFENIPVFVKQLGTFAGKNLGTKDRHAADINEWPVTLKIREFPTLTRTGKTLVV